MLVSGSQSTRLWEKLRTLLGFGPRVARLVTLPAELGSWPAPRLLLPGSLVALDWRMPRPRQIILAVGPLT